jgi:hypothetical protein
MHWYRCNTHTHSSAFPGSDSNGTPEFIAEWYRSHGYQCVVITDHEHLTDVRELNQKYGSNSNFLVLKGQEITQAIKDPTQAGGLRHLHVNGINIDKPIIPVGYPHNPEGVSAAQAYERNIAAIRSAGGIAQVNHPNGQWSVGVDDLIAIRSPYLMEVWNAFPTINNLSALDEAGHPGGTPETLWDALLSRGKMVWAVASDDAHEYKTFDDRETPTPGKAWIVLQAPELTVSALMDALRNGHFYASTGISLASYSVDDKGISMKINPPRKWSPAGMDSTRYTTRFIGAKGQVLAEVGGHDPHYNFKGDEQYVRASIIDSDGRRAWTQPVFRDARPEATR